MDFDPRDYADHVRDRDDDTRELGRGPADSRDSNYDSRHSPEDERWPERERSYDAREPLTRDLNLPRGREREFVRDRGHSTVRSWTCA